MDGAGISIPHMDLWKNRAVDLNTKIIYNGGGDLWEIRTYRRQSVQRMILVRHMIQMLNFSLQTNRSFPGF